MKSISFEGRQRNELGKSQCLQLPLANLYQTKYLPPSSESIDNFLGKKKLDDTHERSK